MQKKIKKTPPHPIPNKTPIAPQLKKLKLLQKQLIQMSNLRSLN